MSKNDSRKLRVICSGHKHEDCGRRGKCDHSRPHTPVWFSLECYRFNCRDSSYCAVIDEEVSCMEVKK